MINIKNHYCYKQFNEQIFDFVIFELGTVYPSTENKRKHCEK